MFRIIADEIHDIDILSSILQEMIVASDLPDFGEIRSTVRRHISERKSEKKNGTESSDPEVLIDRVMDIFIGELPVTEANCRRIRDYVLGYDSYRGYDRLLTDFNGLLNNVERARILHNGKRRFDPELTGHWC